VLSSGCAARLGVPLEPGASTGGMTVLSLNLAMSEDVDRIAAELAAIGAGAADVMLLQEVIGQSSGPDVASRLADRLGLHAVYRQAFTRDDGRTVGLATLSRFPLINPRVLPLASFDLKLRSRSRIALAVDLDTPDGIVSTYNLHLDTRINTDDRMVQVGPVVEDLAAGAGRALVGGDFNTNRQRWLFNVVPVPFARQGSGLERFMESHGLQSAFRDGATHDRLGMRLDWVFVKGLDTASTSIHPIEFSDHHALRVTLAAAGR
jgi:endonuclease/exonuclease/phosphatase family metal-dependent hydrolase